MIAFVFPNLIGTIVLICVAPGPGTQGGLIFAFYLMQCFQAVRIHLHRIRILIELNGSATQVSSLCSVVIVRDSQRGVSPTP
jgi:hypothetical protein